MLDDKEEMTELQAGERIDALQHTHGYDQLWRKKTNSTDKKGSATRNEPISLLSSSELLCNTQAGPEGPHEECLAPND